MNISKNIITKSDFLVYLDSPRHLWALKHNLIPKEEESLYLKHIIEQGYEVEEHAKKLFKDYILIDQQNLQFKSDFKTGKYYLYQPIFLDENFYARADFMAYNERNDCWDIYEVKSASKIKKEYYYDLAFQYLLFSKKYTIGSLYVVYINNDYVRRGEIEADKLFVLEDVSRQVSEILEEVEILMKRACEIVFLSDYSALLECIRPKECSCLDICHPNLPEYSIFDINNLTGNEQKIRKLIKMGIRSIKDVPEDFELSSRQKAQVDIAKKGEISCDKKRLETAFSQLKYPIYFIDYESFNPAIPLFDGYKPFEQISFQWSLHIKRTETETELEHYEFIMAEAIDPVHEFLSSLHTVVGKTGSIVVWNSSFEATQNKKMAEKSLEYKDFCISMNERIFDLMKIFKSRIYVDPKARGSDSIKKVLPAICPAYSYSGMEIGDGSTAMISWYEMVFGEMDFSEKEKIKRNLLNYCELDTYAMFCIYDFLRNLIK